VDVIASHSQADWDAIGSMIVARRLYPGATLALPDPPAALADDFSAAVLRSMDIQTPQSIDPAKVRRLILVGTRRPDQLGALVGLADNPAIELHLYDNHPATPADLDGTLEIRELTGACVSILIPLLVARGLKLKADEATWTLLGLYEKTGGLTLPNTTADDLRTAAQLLDWNANLELVAASRALAVPATHLTLLGDLLHAARRHRVGRTEVVVSEVAVPKSIADTAAVVDRFHHLRGADATFCLLTHEADLTLHGRSTGSGLDLSRVAAAFGGDASPSFLELDIRDASTVQVRRALTELLPTLAPPTELAAALADADAPIFPTTMTVEAAAQRLTRLGLGHALVLDNQRQPAGIVDAAFLGRALGHDFGGTPLGDLVVNPPHGCNADAPINELYALARRQPQPLYPLLREGLVVGAVAREKLLGVIAKAYFVAEPADGPVLWELDTAPINLTETLEELLPEPQAHALKTLSALAAERDIAAFLVGGTVRDLLRRRKNVDLDTLIVGDALALARALAERLNGRATEHEPFGTATVSFPGGHIDLAGARREYYESPGALPTVEPAGGAADLQRRDFSINTLLMDLRPERFGRLVDPLGGQADLRDGVLRVLHGLSFIEDPTRLLRAVRFAVRFGFHFEPGTKRLFATAVMGGFLDRVDGGRIWKELRLGFAEPRPAEVLRTLFARGVLPRLFPRLTLTSALADALPRAGELSAWYAAQNPDQPCKATPFWLSVLTLSLNEAEKREFGVRVALPESLVEDTIVLPRAAAALAHSLESEPPKTPSELVQRLDHVSPTVALLAAAIGDETTVTRGVRHFLGNLTHITPELTGDDLAKMGLEPGPVFGEILAEVREAKLDGKVVSKQDELRWAKKVWQRKISEK
jgi:tRNA nucleotidyltransferase (CCA-adding enzyme)